MKKLLSHIPPKARVALTILMLSLGTIGATSCGSNCEDDAITICVRFVFDNSSTCQPDPNCGNATLHYDKRNNGNISNYTVNTPVTDYQKIIEPEVRDLDGTIITPAKYGTVYRSHCYSDGRKGAGMLSADWTCYNQDGSPKSICVSDKVPKPAADCNTSNQTFEMKMKCHCF